MQSIRSRVLPTLFFFLALILLRYQLVLHLKLSWEGAVSVGLLLGLIYDAVAALGVLALSWGLGTALRIRETWTWSVAAIILWLAAMANTAHYRFFESRLDWWIVKTHVSDLSELAGFAGNLFGSIPSLVSILCIIAAVAFKIGHRHAFVATPARAWRPRVLELGKPILILLFALLLRQTPVWFRAPHVNGSVLYENIVAVWWKDWTTVAEGEITDRDGSPQVSLQDAPGILAKYRDYSNGALRGVADQNRDWPLLHPIEPSPQVTRELRERMGLPAKGPINVLMLFVESARSFELQHPELANKVFPELNQVLETNGIHFTQAYSPARQTVNGQFTSMCSMLPNLLGPIVYQEQPFLRVQCVQNFLKQNGYQTLWINSFWKTYHNKLTFESAHGMDTFYDEVHFKERGITQKTGSWGVADRPFLQESLRLLEMSVQAKAQPFFANVLTISMHGPYRRLDEGKLPESLLFQLKDHEVYGSYLSHTRYTDSALGDFFDSFFKSPIADNTLVVLLGDHSTGIRPHLPLGPGGAMELWSRIPLAFITRNMKKPGKVDYPVHQVDVVPTIAAITGTRGEGTWLGRNMFSGAGTPWVTPHAGSASYRTAERGCYVDSATRKSHCVDLRGNADPLLTATLPAVDERPEETLFFNRVVEASRTAVLSNRFAPADRPFVRRNRPQTEN